MFSPPHPGLTLRDDVLPALGLTVTDAAQQLGVARVSLSRVLNGRAAIADVNLACGYLCHILSNTVSNCSIDTNKEKALETIGVESRAAPLEKEDSGESLIF